MTKRNSNLISARIALIGLVSSAAWGAAGSYSPHKFQQNDWFAEFGQPGAQYNNPALMTEIDQVEGSLALFRTINYQAGQEYLSLAVPYDYKHTFGFTFFLNGATLDGGAAYTENAYMFGYAYRPIHHLSIGANLNLLQINQFDLKQQVTPGLDFGVTWNPKTSSKLGFLQFGAAVQNVLQPVIRAGTGENDGMEYLIQYVNDDNTYAVPMNLNVGAFWRGNVFGSHQNLEVKAEAGVIDLMHVESEGGISDPLQKIETSLSAKYYLNYMLGLKLRLTKEGYPVIGSSVNMKDLNLFKYLQWDLEMSHDDLRTDTKNRGFILASKLTTRVGPTREETIGFDRYERLKLEPERDFKRAMAKFQSRDFLGAAYDFGKILTKYTGFHLLDQAAYLKGKSFENMQMNRAARETYSKAIEKLPFSEKVADYKLRLMAIDYKEGKFDAAMNKYAEIASKYAQHDVKLDADYLAGQLEFNRDNFQEAIKYLKTIPAGNSNYAYANYTMGIAATRLKDFNGAEKYFKNVIGVKAVNTSESDIQSAARVKLGHIYFSWPDTPKMQEAKEQYEAVLRDKSIMEPSKGTFFDESVLGLAWSWLKINKPDQAEKFVDIILKTRQGSFMVPEAHLVKGYIQFAKAKGKDKAGLKEAQASIEKCKSLLAKETISAEEKAAEDKKYNDMKGDFEKVQVRVQELSMRLPTQRVREQRDQLLPDFSKAMGVIEDHTEFLKRMEQSRQFENSRQKLIQDADYALFTITKKLNGGGAVTEERREEL